MEHLKLFLKFSYGTIIGFILSFVSTIFATRYFSPQSYGVLSIYTVIVTTSMVFITLGTDNAFVRFFNEYSTLQRPLLLKKTIKFPFRIFILICIPTLFLYKYISNFLVGEENIYIILLLLLSIFSDLILRFASLILRMQKKANLYSLIQILHKLTYLILLLFTFKIMDNNYWPLLLSYAFGITISSIFSVLFDYRFWTSSSIGSENIDQKKIINYSIPFMFSSTLIVINENIDKILIKFYLNDLSLGIYSAGFKLVAIVTLFQGMISTILVPIFYEHFEKNIEDKSLYKNSFNIISFIMLLTSILFITFKDIIILFLGADYRNVANIIPFLIFGPLMYTISETTVIGINFRKKSIYHIYISIIVLTSSLIFNNILIPKFGLLGAGISYSLSSIIYFISRSIFAYKAYPIKYKYMKFSIILLIFYIYAYSSSQWLNVLLNIYVGIAFIGILICLYYNDIKSVVKKIIKKI